MIFKWPCQVLIRLFGNHHSLGREVLNVSHFISQWIEVKIIRIQQLIHLLIFSWMLIWKLLVAYKMLLRASFPSIKQCSSEDLWSRDPHTTNSAIKMHILICILRVHKGADLPLLVVSDTTPAEELCTRIHPSFFSAFLSAFLPAFPPSLLPFQDEQEKKCLKYKKYFLPEVFGLTGVTNRLNKERKDPPFLAVSIIIDIAGMKEEC